MVSTGQAPVVILYDGQELARAAGAAPREGTKLNLSSRLHPGRLLSYRVTSVERWYGGVGPASEKGVRAGQTFVRVGEVIEPPVPPSWLDDNPFAPVVLLRKDGVVLARTTRDAEPQRDDVLNVDSPHLGRVRAYRVLDVEWWPANLDLDEPVITWGDTAVHVVEIAI